MAMVKMQVFLPTSLKERVEHRAEERHQSFGAVTRMALSRWVQGGAPRDKILKVLRETAGAWKHRKDIRSGISYVRKIREESERRLQKLLS